MTYREQTLAELNLAQIPHYEAEGPSGLPEVHVLSDEGQHLIVLFTREGSLLAMECDGCADAAGEAP